MTSPGMQTSVVSSSADLSDAKLINLLRHSAGDLSAYLETLECDVKLDSTETHAHCYFLALDGNRRPRVNDFARFIAEKIVDFAIPRTEVERVQAECTRLNSTAPILRLATKARKLFTRLPQSGEGGEVLLSILAEHFLGLPQLFTKMVLKTNTEMHVHGSDAIHFGVNKQNGNLTLYWGESKLYQNATDGIRKCFESLAPFLLDPGGGRSTQERDLQLMRDGIDLIDNSLEGAIKSFLDPNDARFKKLEYRGVCLVGFDSNAYPDTPNTKTVQQVKGEIETAFEHCKCQISSRVTQENLHTFDIQIFCVPFPSVESFREAFRNEIGV